VAKDLRKEQSVKTTTPYIPTKRTTEKEMKALPSPEAQKEGRPYPGIAVHSHGTSRERSVRRGKKKRPQATITGRTRATEEKKKLPSTPNSRGLRWGQGSIQKNYKVKKKTHSPSKNS